MALCPDFPQLKHLMGGLLDVLLDEAEGLGLFDDDAVDVTCVTLVCDLYWGLPCEVLGLFEEDDPV